MKQKTRTRSKNEVIECLACEDDVYIGRNPKIGNYVVCHNCDAEFQIIDLEPVLIDWPDEDDDFFDGEEGYFDDINEENDY